MVVSNTLNTGRLSFDLREWHHDPSDSNLTVVSLVRMRDLVKSTLLENLTPSSKRSCDVESVQSTIWDT